jgi:hypothetical protein
MYVYPKLIGGIGNQLFILASAIGYSEKTGRKVIFVEKVGNPHCNDDIPITDLFPDIPIHYDKNGKGVEISGGIFEYTELKNSTNEIVCISGYNQHIKYFPKEFTSWSKYLPNLDLKFDYKNSCFLHVRRTDYLTVPHLGIDLKNYWKKALSLFDNSIDIVVFSDDINWASEELPKIDSSKNFIFVSQKLTATQTLKQMMKCEKGAICANSTFSWWGAWLNKNRKIVLPVPWSYFDTNEDLGIYFEDVIKIDIT